MRIGIAIAFSVTMALSVQAASEPPPLPKTKADRQAFATTICAEMSARAAEHGLPESFMARLIWKESLFDPGAVSPKGAEGIAQFMPGTARLRGLEDPFDPTKALAASSAYLAELKSTFGNLGRAAAAYNAGEERVRKWLAGDGGLPYETQDYVLSITGRGHEEWKVEGADFAIPAIGKSADFPAECRALVMRELSPEQAPGERANWKPWGVVLSGGFSEARALLTFRRIRGRYESLLKDEPPLVLRNAGSLSWVRKARTSCAASRTCVQVTPSPGSRSNVMRSGLSIAFLTAFQVWNSITFIWAADSRPSGRAISSIGWWSGDSAGSSCSTPGML